MLKLSQMKKEKILFRFDQTELPKVKKTKEGYLRGQAIVSRTGVFKYQERDGSIRSELRHPDDILSSCSTESLKGIPITIAHPTELLDSNNAESLSVGYTGENIKIDGQNLIVTLTVTHQKAIEAIEAGKQELSLGYTLDLEREDGEYNGEVYTHRQKNVVYNHLALVERARAGAQARLNFDHLCYNSFINKETKGEPMSENRLVTVKLDGLDYQASPEIDKELRKHQKNIESLQKNLDAKEKDSEKEMDEMKAKYDEMKAKYDELKKEYDELKGKRGDAEIAVLAKERVKLLTQSKDFINVDSFYEKSEREIKEAVIKSRYNSIDLSGKSNDYVTARFDALIESFEKEEKNLQSNAKKLLVNSDSKKEVLDGVSVLKSLWNVHNKKVGE